MLCQCIHGSKEQVTQSQPNINLFAVFCFYIQFQFSDGPWASHRWLHDWQSKYPNCHGPCFSRLGFRWLNVRGYQYSAIVPSTFDICVCVCLFLHSYVVNYDFPRTIEDYVHRVGRTGRAGRTGTCISYVNGSDWRMVPELIQIMEKSGQTIPLRLRTLESKIRNHTPSTAPMPRRISFANFTGGNYHFPPLSNKNRRCQNSSLRN